MILYHCEFPPDHHIEIRITNESGTYRTVRVSYDGKRVKGIKPWKPTAAPVWQGVIGDMPIMVYIGGNEHPAMLLTGPTWRDQVDGDCIKDHE
jgi:hypothetical protein